MLSPLTGAYPLVFIVVPLLPADPVDNRTTGRPETHLRAPARSRASSARVEWQPRRGGHQSCRQSHRMSLTSWTAANTPLTTLAATTSRIQRPCGGKAPMSETRPIQIDRKSGGEVERGD